MMNIFARTGAVAPGFVPYRATCAADECAVYPRPDLASLAQGFHPRLRRGDAVQVLGVSGQTARPTWAGRSTGWAQVRGRTRDGIEYTGWVLRPWLQEDAPPPARAVERPRVPVLRAPGGGVVRMTDPAPSGKLLEVLQPPLVPQQSTGPSPFGSRPAQSNLPIGIRRIGRPARGGASAAIGADVSRAALDAAIRGGQSPKIVQGLYNAYARLMAAEGRTPDTLDTVRSLLGAATGGAATGTVAPGTLEESLGLPLTETLRAEVLENLRRYIAKAEARVAAGAAAEERDRYVRELRGQVEWNRRDGFATTPEGSIAEREMLEAANRIESYGYSRLPIGISRLRRGTRRIPLASSVNVNADTSRLSLDAAIRGGQSPKIVQGLYSSYARLMAAEGRVPDTLDTVRGLLGGTVTGGAETGLEFENALKAVLVPTPAAEAAHNAYVAAATRWPGNRQSYQEKILTNLWERYRAEVWAAVNYDVGPRGLSANSPLDGRPISRLGKPRGLSVPSGGGGGTSTGAVDDAWARYEGAVRAGQNPKVQQGLYQQYLAANQARGTVGPTGPFGAGPWSPGPIRRFGRPRRP